MNLVTSIDDSLVGNHEEPVWPVYQRYNPWVMGGPVLTRVRFPVYRFARFLYRFTAGETDQTVSFFVYEVQPGDWDTHERSTGAFLHQSNRPVQAIELTLYFLRETPDFIKQIARFGPYETARVVDEVVGRTEIRQVRERER